jgi:hypothetical protein
MRDREKEVIRDDEETVELRRLIALPEAKVRVERFRATSVGDRLCSN